ncbi:MAG: hypothetical protein M3Y86_03860, partial [Verrucomicrobiota bacterium]|nr:hypothetical protein [Verrucomicrobiota bacterium]
MNPPISHAPAPPWREGWRQLYGDFERLGLSVEWHDFRPAQPLNWGETFRPRSVEFCLNLEGRGVIGARSQGDYIAGSSGYYAVADGPLPASRRGGERHQFVTLEFSRAQLQRQLADCEADLDPQLRRAVFAEETRNIVSTPRPMAPEQRSVVA